MGSRHLSLHWAILFSGQHWDVAGDDVTPKIFFMEKESPHSKWSLPNLLVPNEVATKLGISRTTLYRLVETRKLPFYKVGGGLRFSEEDLAAYLKDHRIDSISIK